MAIREKTIDRDFAESLLKTFDDPYKNGVHILFNEWWQYADESTKDSYVAQMTETGEFESLTNGSLYNNTPLTIEALEGLPAGSLGRAFHDWIISNNLTIGLATNYKAMHEKFKSDGILEGMPPEMESAVLRAYQTHDFQHVVTGYDSSPAGEIALQSFGFGQVRFPYFGMWMSVSMTRMTFLSPHRITEFMDAIADGWELGRRSPNIQCVKWEDMLDQPLAEVRKKLGITPTGISNQAIK